MNKSLSIAAFLLTLLSSRSALAQVDSVKIPADQKKWYDNISIRGYAQFRYNRILESNPELKCSSCDRSWGKDGGFFIRRMRMTIFGQVHPRVYLQLQPDFANNPSSTAGNYVQLRDAYADIGLDKKNEYRIRVGQSKIPFGFENMQSSQNRLALDRTDGINSALPNERDMGAIFYWAPQPVRKLFSQLVNDGLKGSGDYGVFALGLYNGQTTNRPELNNELHVVSRLTYPFKIGRHIFEPSVQAYYGNYVIETENISTGVKVNKTKNYLDSRAGAGFTLYPQPFGVQVEYNIGVGPEFNKATDSIDSKQLYGGYLLLNYLYKYKKQIFIPFVRAYQYKGGKKNELDARSYDVKELEIGIEWQPVKNFELTAQFTMSDRKFEDYKLQNNQQKGHLLRLQAQVNF